jgi:hypothetical protein
MREFTHTRKKKRSIIFEINSKTIFFFAMNKDAELNWSNDDDDDDGGYDGSEKSEAPNKCDERPKEGDERYE